MQKLSLIFLVSATILWSSFSRSEQTGELWYKGLRKDATTDQEKKDYYALPNLYYTVGTLDDFEQKRVNPFNLKMLSKGEKIPLSLDKTLGKRIIISDKKSPAIDDEVYSITLAGNKDAFLRFRLLEPQEQAPHSFTFQGKRFLFGPQSGKGLVAKTSESGYSLKNNIAVDGIDIQKKKIRDLLPYVVPTAPSAPQPASQEEGIPPTKNGIYEISNRIKSTVYYMINDTGKPISKDLTERSIASGKTDSGWFSSAKPSTLYISPTPFKNLKDGQEVTYFEFPAHKDLFVATEYYQNTFNLRAYFICGSTIGKDKRAIARIGRCKKYGVQSWQIIPKTGIYRGGVILQPVS